MRTSSRVLTRRHLLAAAAAALPTSLFAQGAGYPNRPVDLIVPAGAGGGTDVLARVFSDVARKHFSQPITVVNPVSYTHLTLPTTPYV